jgi:hypothetical protein
MQFLRFALVTSLISLTGCLGLSPSETQSLCGGITGETCPSGQVCIDDPSDSCDPESAADCGGICQPNPGCGEDADCREGEFCDLAAVLCLEGTECGTCKSIEYPESCGGIAAFPCPDGQECIDNPNDNCDPNNGGADCSGVCVAPPEESTFCGGIANFPCPGGQACIDDPNDNCDPNNGGADCGGVCVVIEEECEFCGGIANIACPDGKVCIDDPDSCENNGGADCGGFCVPDPCSAHTDTNSCEADVENDCAVAECPPNADCAFSCKQLAQ